MPRISPFAALALLIAGRAGAQQATDFTPYLMPDRAAEVALARTAAPAEVSDSAAVLVLTRSGYVEVARGTNGFTCVVLRSFSGSVNDPGFWNPRVRAPHCFNQPAVRTVLPVMLNRAEWILAGASPAEVEARTRREYTGGAFPKPAPGAMAYMLSPRAHLLDADPPWLPHLMFYFDRSFPAAAWGAGGMTSPIINGSAGEPQAPVLTLLIPVRQWSDGTPALPEAGRQVN